MLTKRIRKILVHLPMNSVSFGSKSAIIAAALAATGRAFAGSNPSGSGLLTSKGSLTTIQRAVLKDLVIQKLETTSLPADQRETLESIVERLEKDSVEESEHQPNE